jgi:hypothetical protein
MTEKSENAALKMDETPSAGPSIPKYTAKEGGPDRTILEIEGNHTDSSGSKSREFSDVLMNQVTHCLWFGSSDRDTYVQQAIAADVAMRGIAPKDELEGMLAAQMVATHNAAMECYRRAMIPEQPRETWQMRLNQANKLVRSFAALTEALNRHRGKGVSEQKVTVEHVHIYDGGQAIVGAVSQGGRGQGARKKQRQPHEGKAKGQPQLESRAGEGACPSEVWSEEAQRQAVPSPRNAKRAL